MEVLRYYSSREILQDRYLSEDERLDIHAYALKLDAIIEARRGMVDWAFTPRTLHFEGWPPSLKISPNFFKKSPLKNSNEFFSVNTYSSPPTGGSSGQAEMDFLDRRGWCSPPDAHCPYYKDLL